MKAKLPANEDVRLQALRNLAILDTPAESSFDDIVKIATALCNVPVALISLIDVNRQWFKACIGLDGSETPRDYAFCAHAILQPHDLLIVEDAWLDKRFADNPLVTGAPGIRFYAGAPLVDQQGIALGTLCVIDYQPRQLDAPQQAALAALARQVMQLFNLRAANQQLRQNADNVQLMSDSLPVLIGQLDAQQRYVFCNYKYREWHGLSPEDMLGKTPMEIYGEHLSSIAVNNMLRCYNGETVKFEFLLHNRRTLDVSYVPQWSEGKVVGMFVVAADISARKQQEMILHNEREQLSSIIKGANVGTWELNIQTGAAVFNERWASMLGYTLEELQPVSFSTWLSLTHADDLPHANQLLHRHYQGELEYYDCQFRMRHKVGRWVWIHAHGRLSSRTETGEPLLMFGTHVDITDLMESRRALEEKEELFRSMLSNLPGAVYRCANDSQWTMHFLSDEVKILTGYPASDFIANDQRSFNDLIHPDDKAPVARIIRDAIQSEQGFMVEYRIQRADGTWRWLQEVGRGIFDEHHRLKYLDGFIWDITEREAINNAMRINEQKLSTLYNMVPVAIALHRVVDGQLVEGNPELFRMTGYSEQQFRQLDYWQTTPLRYERAEEEQLIQLRETGRYGPYEKYIIHRDGHWIPVLVNGVLVEGDGGEQYVWSIVQDITERKRIEQMKNEFVSAVSHELRTPLTSISGALKLMVSGALGEMPEKSRTMLDIAYKNSERLTLLINDLLDMEKLLAGKMTFNFKEQPLQPLLERAVYENQNYADHYQVVLQLSGSASDLMIRVDEQRFLQVMANILSNAAKFSPAGAKVEIAVESTRDRVRIIVIDLGCGIPLEFQGRLFQKFSQADSSASRQKGGTGLGLAITKELLEHMNGSISFESRPGVGTRFYIDLPIH
jgi:PAS domain S-box-containing protein